MKSMKSMKSLMTVDIPLTPWRQSLAVPFHAPVGAHGPVNGSKTCPNRYGMYKNNGLLWWSGHDDHLVVGGSEAEQ